MFFSIRRNLVSASALLGIFTVMVCNVASAQTNTPGAAPAAPQAPPILTVNDPQNPFHLTAEQQKEFFNIRVQFQKDATAILQNTSIPGPQKQGRIEALQTASAAKLKLILSPAQRTSMDKLQAKQAVVINLQKKARAILTQLDASVTPSQKRQITALQTSVQTQQSTIQNSSASNAVKTDEMNQLRAQFTSQIASIFNSPTQQALIAELKKTQQQMAAAAQQLQATAH